MSGADRAGLVAALYSYAIDGKSAEAAAGQLSLLYGDFPYLTSGTIAMDESFWRYAKTSSAPLDRARDQLPGQDQRSGDLTAWPHPQ